MTNLLTEEQAQAVLATKWHALTDGQKRFVHNRQAEAAEQNLTFSPSERVQLVEIAEQGASNEQAQAALERLHDRAHFQRFNVIAASFTPEQEHAFRNARVQLDHVGLGDNSHALHRTAASVKQDDPGETTKLIDDLSRRIPVNTTFASKAPDYQTTREAAFAAEQRRVADAERGQKQWENYEKHASQRSMDQHLQTQSGGKYDRLNERPRTAAERRAAAREELTERRQEENQGSRQAPREESRSKREEREAEDRSPKGERGDWQTRLETARRARAEGGRVVPSHERDNQNESGRGRPSGRSR